MKLITDFDWDTQTIVLGLNLVWERDTYGDAPTVTLAVSAGPLTFIVGVVWGENEPLR